MPQLIAIDPGASGGIAWMDADGNPNADRVDMATCHLPFLRASTNDLELHLEDPSFGGLGVISKSSIGKLQRHVGFVQGLAQGLGIRTLMVRPQTWQKALGLGTRATYGARWKNHLKEEAQRRFPSLTVTLATADALLILDWARGKRG